jgi:hypothetical protein
MSFRNLYHRAGVGYFLGNHHTTADAAKEAGEAELRVEPTTSLVFILIDPHSPDLLLGAANQVLAAFADQRDDEMHEEQASALQALGALTRKEVAAK